MREIYTIFLLAIMCQATAAERYLDAWPAPRPIDPKKLSEAGLRILRSEHCTMVTDLPTSAEVDRLPNYIDQAIEPWSKRFGVKKSDADGWRLRVYVMQDRARFDALKLMPESNDRFPDGFAYGYEAWLYDQPSSYYRRHLLLHEGTHSFMMTQLGSCGPSWYMEGMAELCGTHRFNDKNKSVQLATFPTSRKETPHWGRVRLIRDQVARDNITSIRSLMRIDNRHALEVDAYAWLWALAKFLDTHPRYQERWRSLVAHVNDERFDERFWDLFEKDILQLTKEWQLYQKNLEYGHDIPREAIRFDSGVPISGKDKRLKIAADQGWQPTGVLVEKGQTYRIDARGKYVVGQESDGKPWPSEANGISLSYYHGQPLGKLMAMIDSESSANLEPFPVGVHKIFKAKRTGTLYLRINDHPSRLAENRGSVAVRVAID